MKPKWVKSGQQRPTVWRKRHTPSSPVFAETGLPILDQLQSLSKAILLLIWKVILGAGLSIASLTTANPPNFFGRNQRREQLLSVPVEVLSVCTIAAFLVDPSPGEASAATELIAAIGAGGSPFLKSFFAFIISGFLWVVVLGPLMATAFRLDMTDGARWAASIFVATIIAFVVAALLLGAISNNEEQSAKAIVGALVISSATGPLAAVSMVRLGLQQSYAPRKAIIYTFAAFVMAGPLCLMLAANALYTDLDENLPYLQRWLYATKYKETPRFTATGGNCSIKEGVEPALECLLTATLLTHNSVVLHRNIYSVSLHEKLSPQLLLEDENAPLDPDEVQGKSRITDGKAAIVLFSVDQGFDAITIEKDKPINLSLTIQKAACGTIEHSFLYPPPLQLYISIETMPLNQGAGEGVLLNASTSMVNSLPYGAVLSGKVDDFALLGTWKLPTRLLYKFMDKCEHRPKRHE